MSKVSLEPSVASERISNIETAYFVSPFAKDERAQCVFYEYFPQIGQSSGYFFTRRN